MNIKFYFHRPLEHFSTRIRESSNLKDEFRRAEPIGCGGDVDNHVKFVLDSFEDVVYANDRQVMSLKVEKKYSNNEFQFTEIMCTSPGYDPITDVEFEVVQL